MASIAFNSFALSVLTVAATTIVPQASQASILGDQLQGVYFFPDLQTRDEDVTFTPFLATVKPGPFATIDLGSAEIPISYSSTARTETLSFGNVTPATANTSVSFDGPLLTVYSGQPFGPVVSTTGLGAGAITDNGAAVYVNFAKYDGDPVSVTFALSSVPLPASLPLFGTALLAVAGVGCGARHRKGKRGTASAA